MIDVCLILEGTYPYVAGGVSTWVHQLISAMKNIRFGIVYIAAHSDPTRQIKYEVPPQVIYFKEIYLHDAINAQAVKKRPQAKDFKVVHDFYLNMINKRDSSLFPELVRLFKGDKACLNAESFLRSEGIWDIMVEFYSKYAGEISFLDYFWTFRGIHTPLLQIFSAELPRASIYHAVSTGYAGLLGAISKTTYDKKFFLTEHGIYTQERKLEISQASWIYEREKKNYRADKELSFFKQLWIGLFEILSSLTYKYSDQTITLFEGNKVSEILAGADPQKISIIPNGLDLKAYTYERERKKTPQIGLVGRVVSIKDIKTFIHAVKYTLNQIPEARFYILGPTEEEKEYYEECKSLIENLNLGDKITFTGRVDINEYYRFLDLVVLTSISEAQPYVIIEANIMGIPVVATDVGACREMLEGNTLEDKALGPSGLVTEVANPGATAQAISKLLSDKTFYDQCSEAGKSRVKKYYDQDDLLSRYLNLYEQNL